MKRLIAAAVAASALLAVSAASAETAPAAQTPVYDAQAYAVLHNIEARIAELNMKLSAPQVQGCSDGEHVYSQGFRITRNPVIYRCDFVDGQYKWTSVNGY